MKGSFFCMRHFRGYIDNTKGAFPYESALRLKSRVDVCCSFAEIGLLYPPKSSQIPKETVDLSWLFGSFLCNPASATKFFVPHGKLKSHAGERRMRTCETSGSTRNMDFKVNCSICPPLHGRYSRNSDFCDRLQAHCPAGLGWMLLRTSALQLLPNPGSKRDAST